MPIRRTIKNVVKNFTDPQVKVREATSNDPWGPSSTLMSEIADLTYNVVAFTEIMQMIWKRLNDHGKNWRHVYKSLVLLDYIIKTGSEKVAQQCKENIFAIQTLKDFQYIEDNKDQGMNVREKAKQLVNLLKDEERLKNERAKALKAKERFAQNSMSMGSQQMPSRPMPYSPDTSPTLQSGSGGYSDPYGGATGTGYDEPATSPTNPLPAEFEAARPATVGEEELQLQLALAMSKEEHEEETRKYHTDEVKVQLAIEESKREVEEETKRMRLIDQSEKAPARSSLVDLLGSVGGAPTIQDPWGAPMSQPPPQPPATDPWGGAVAQGAAPTADPWGSPAKNPVTSAVAADPWGGGGGSGTSGSNHSTPRHTPDPWGAPSPVPAQSLSSTSPAGWSAPAPTSQPSHSTGFDAFGSDGFTNGTSDTAAKSGTLDDAFDMLSNRSTPAPSGGSDLLAGGLSDFPTTPEQPNMLDIMGSVTAADVLVGSSNVMDLGMGQNAAPQNAFDLSGLNQGLLGSQPERKKSPADFLGANASLVNLDNLVTRPATTAQPDTTVGRSGSPHVESLMNRNDLQTTAFKSGAPPNANMSLGNMGMMSTGYLSNGPGSSNPFAGMGGSATNNPFGPTPAARIPMNQMQPVGTGFTQTSNLPNPMMPLGGGGMMQPQPTMQSNNPFL